MSLIILGSSWSRELAPHLAAHPTLHPAIPLGVCIKPYSFRLHESLKKGLGDLEVEAACSFPGQSPTTVTSFPCQPTLNWSLLCHNQKPSEIFPKQKNNALPGERKKGTTGCPQRVGSHHSGFCWPPGRQPVCQQVGSRERRGFEDQLTRTLPAVSRFTRRHHGLSPASHMGTHGYATVHDLLGAQHLRGDISGAPYCPSPVPLVPCSPKLPAASSLPQGAGDVTHWLGS